MKLDQSIKNIDQVIANAPMTRYDHDELKSNLAFLVARAKLADIQDHQINELEKRIEKIQEEETVIEEEQNG